MMDMLFWIVVGMVIKVFVPMPWFDDAVRGVYAKVWSWFKG